MSGWLYSYISNSFKYLYQYGQCPVLKLAHPENENRKIEIEREIAKGNIEKEQMQYTHRRRNKRNGRDEATITTTK